VGSALALRRQLGRSERLFISAPPKYWVRYLQPSRLAECKCCFLSLSLVDDRRNGTLSCRLKADRKMKDNVATEKRRNTNDKHFRNPFHGSSGQVRSQWSGCQPAKFLVSFCSPEFRTMLSYHRCAPLADHERREPMPKTPNHMQPGRLARCL
jgi:hypothetical protein